MNHVIERQKELAKNILNIYSNKESLTTKVLSIEDFQKSYPIEEFSIVTDEIIKSFSMKAVDEINKIKNEKEKAEFINKAAEDINSFESILVKSENGAIEKFHVKKKSKDLEKAEDYSKWTAEQHKEKAEFHEKEQGKAYDRGNYKEQQNHMVNSKKHFKLAKEKSNK